jgi:hypothetical protein
MSRKISRKVIIALAAAAALAAPVLGSNASFARGFGGGGGGMHFSGHLGGSGHAMFAHRATGSRFSSVGRLQPIFPRHPHHPHLPPIWIGHWWHHHHHHHWHWVFRGGRWIEGDDVAVDATPAPVVAPGPCNCLTKTYTPTGLVVFADICTKESASAPAADDTADASQAPSTPVPAKATPISEVPTTPNYAGKTYNDYLAANPQVNPQASVQGPQQN